MVVKINSQPITVSEEEAKERDFDPVYFGVSCLGYGFSLWILDYVCSVFFFIHPFPIIAKIGGVVAWVIGIL